MAVVDKVMWLNHLETHMSTFSSGDTFHHSVHGVVELYGFMQAPANAGIDEFPYSPSDTDTEAHTPDRHVLFFDENGQNFVEHISVFYQHVQDNTQT